MGNIQKQHWSQEAAPETKPMQLGLQEEKRMQEQLGMQEQFANAVSDKRTTGYKKAAVDTATVNERLLCLYL